MQRNGSHTAIWTTLVAQEQVKSLCATTSGPSDVQCKHQLERNLKHIQTLGTKNFQLQKEGTQQKHQMRRLKFFTSLRDETGKSSCIRDAAFCVYQGSHLIWTRLAAWIQSPQFGAVTVLSDHQYLLPDCHLDKNPTERVSATDSNMGDEFELGEWFECMRVAQTKPASKVIRVLHFFLFGYEYASCCLFDRTNQRPQISKHPKDPFPVRGLWSLKGINWTGPLSKRPPGFIKSETSLNRQVGREGSNGRQEQALSTDQTHIKHSTHTTLTFNWCIFMRKCLPSVILLPPDLKGPTDSSRWGISCFLLETSWSALWRLLTFIKCSQKCCIVRKPVSCWSQRWRSWNIMDFRLITVRHTNAAHLKSGCWSNVVSPQISHSKYDNSFVWKQENLATSSWNPVYGLAPMFVQVQKLSSSQQIRLQSLCLHLHWLRFTNTPGLLNLAFLSPRLLYGEKKGFHKKVWTDTAALIWATEENPTGPEEKSRCGVLPWYLSFPFGIWYETGCLEVLLFWTYLCIHAATELLNPSLCQTQMRLCRSTTRTSANKKRKNPDGSSWFHRNFLGKWILILQLDTPILFEQFNSSRNSSISRQSAPWRFPERTDRSVFMLTWPSDRACLSHWISVTFCDPDCTYTCLHLLHKMPLRLCECVTSFPPPKRQSNGTKSLSNFLSHAKADL